MFIVVRALMFCSLLLLSLTFPSRAAAQCGAARIPQTIVIAPELRAAMTRMLQVSPTFRAQVERIAQSSSVIVTIRLEPPFDGRSLKARSRIRRYDSGLLIVTMEIGPGVQEPQWIAHEFEHVLELLDGLDLPALARRRTPGVWFSAPDVVETMRAVQAGAAVAGEMRGTADSDNLVQ
jgi:hypothetical protein